MKDAIRIENLKKTYTDFSIDNISLSVPKGFITGFIGPNGSGKTTVIKTIMSLVKAEEGTITINNDYSVEDTGMLNSMAFVTDSNYLSKDWTADDSRKIFKMFFDSWDDAKFYNLLERQDLPRNKKIKGFSKGMQMKLMISIALSYESKILILDEPTSGLDPSSRYQIMDLIQEYVETGERTVLFSTHITSDLEQIADYILFILKGRIIYSGSKDDLLESFVIVKGGLDDINLVKEKVIGLKENKSYFEGLIETKYRISDKRLTYETVSLDDLIVFMNRGEYNEENN